MLSRRDLWVLAAFGLLTLVLTYPIPVQIDRAVKDLGDPLLNSWILASEVRSLSDPEAGSFFDTNIFHPHSNTLAYSETLLPQLVLAAVPILLSDNPVLGHNVVLLASFFLTALCTYLLVMHLTRHRLASFTAGLIFAFCPFMFSHLSHVQVIFAAGIPLTFLYLHRFVETGRTTDAVGFAFSYSIQVLANTYYGVYLSFFAGLYFLVSVVRSGRIVARRFWLQLGLMAAIVALLIGPVYLHYFELKSEMGFTRGLPPPRPISAFLAAPEVNRLYGQLTAPLRQHEAQLFPGFIALGLAAVALLGRVRRTKEYGTRMGPDEDGETGTWWRFRIARWLVMTVALVTLALALGWSLDAGIGPVRLRISSLRNPLVVLVLTLTAYWWMHRRWPERSQRLVPTIPEPTYPIILLTAFVLALGGPPYQLLHRWLPGFDSLRALTRIHVMFMLALAVLAAEGLVILLGMGSRRQRRLIAVLIPTLVVLEYFSAPLPVVAAPKAAEFPPVQQWLAALRDDPVIVSLPFRRPAERRRVFYSTLHWHRTVNGFSGFIPPVYEELAFRSRRFPSEPFLLDLAALDVDLVVVETEGYRRRARRQLLNQLRRQQALQSVRDFDGVLVYRLLPSELEPETTKADQQPMTLIDDPHMRLSASLGTDQLHRIRDGKAKTRWNIPMQPEEWIQIELSEPRKVAGLELDLSGIPRHYPRGYRIQVSIDGEEWTTVRQEQEFRPPITDFLTPVSFTLRLEISPIVTRFVRLVQSGSSNRYPWSISELEVVGPAN